MLIGVLIIGVVAGLWLIRAGRRGRVIDDHPVCARCRYDLAGGATIPSTCPECGRSLCWPGTVVVGNRQCSPRKVAIGAAMVAPGALMLLLALGSLLFGTAFDSVKPAWLLSLQMRHNAPGSSAAAVAEVERRIWAKSISAASMQAIVEDLLAMQADPAAAWSPRFGDVIEEAIAAGLATPQQGTAYLLNAVRGRYSIVVRERVKPSARLATRIEVGPLRAGSDGGASIAMMIDGMTWQGVTVTAAEIAALDRVMMVDGDERAGSVTQLKSFETEDSGDLILHVMFHLEPAGFAGGATRNMLAPVPLATVSLDHVSPHTIDSAAPIEVEMDEALAQSVRDSIEVVDLRVGKAPPGKPARWILILKYTNPPIDVACDVYVRSGDAESKGWRASGIVMRANRSGNGMAQGSATIAEPGGPITVILRPNMEAAESDPLITRVWGRDIVIENVPVH